MKKEPTRKGHTKGSLWVTTLLFLNVLLLSLWAMGVSAHAATYYIAPNGNDGYAGTSSSPWATFSKAMGVLKAGDTLLIKDGTYYQSLNVTVSGTTGNPITFKAQNDGQAIIDGQSARVPCKINGESGSSRRHDINVEGLVCKNSNSEVFQVYYADRINVKRVSGYDANPTGNYHIFSVDQATYVLLEDCAATGKGRVMFNIYDSQYCTVRRCWGLQEEGWTSNYPNADGGGVQIYGSDNCIAENNVIRKHPNYTYYLMSGVTVWCASYNASANNNTILGNIVRDANLKSFGTSSATHVISGNTWDNNVGINNTGQYCYFHTGDGNLSVDHLTCNMSGTYDYYMRGNYGDPLDKGFIVAGTLNNSSFLGGTYGIHRDQPDPYVGTLTHTYNNFYNVSTCYSNTTSSTGEHCNTLNPSYDTATYGKGAYLTVPPALQGRGEGGADIGAEVLYRYQDGKLTNEPLWPWPMEDRIYRETGISVTWESKGGLWKTLSGVYK